MAVNFDTAVEWLHDAAYVAITCGVWHGLY
ncbi:hypothetical protein B0I00_2933 [Novosphingobium kunmingense]|uniref:Uncharacterized protein n=1 Tax=Novosphingobium kunmingense TaxID=1211806 RepID=A0A2N0H5R9_9SPHN|nr:hypothetical protein B0I00_2933 [Novosphingobium kunmingense]